MFALFVISGIAALICGCIGVFDLMACGGFVLSNYQSEIPDIFVPDEDIVLYESIPDMLNKIEYYLTHEDERLSIAKNGYEKVKTLHSYDQRLLSIFNTCINA